MRQGSSPFLCSLVAFSALALSAAQAEAASIDSLVIPGIGPSTPLAAPPPSHDNLGGGFIEFVLTGQSGGARPVSQPTGAARPVAAQPAMRTVALARQGDLEAEPSEEFRRQEVDYSGPERPGAIIIDTPRKYLFLVLPGGRALRYGVGVGRPGFEWGGVKTVSRKAEWPGWTPPAEMRLRRPDLPDHMDGGPGNPLGARALYLGSSMYRIHGTNEPSTIGKNVSSGCIRMMNEDVIDLYDRVRVGAKVIVM
ncbi:MAG TPA: L,D-transpeptidase [Roseiarcus sp.]